ncbi:MAG TPA: S-layer homology domain-containing protein [Candidatus Peribacteraceae bacterium]|nr:S-layer homology domain-containing protein [Candidatus Peribacteraceae bacterium]
MDISRMKKLFAGVSAVVISLTQVGSVFAAYSDVPAGVWYGDAVKAFTDAGYLDASQTMFRGSDNANRAEFTKLVVELNGGILSTPPAVASFDDVATGAWYYGYMEEAAKEGWVKGDNNCYGTHPCYARPADNINRAEAAALIVRAFGLDSTGAAPSFVDVPAGQWYTSAVQTAADHCVLQGDDATGRARPSDFMNRAEMVVMLHRVDQNLTFGVDCGKSQTLTPAIKSADMLDATTVEVQFNTNVDSKASIDSSHYSVSGDATLSVTSVKAVDASTVDLTLSSATTAGGHYTLSVQDMLTADGKTFSDTQDFTGYSPIAQGNGTLEVSLSSTNPVGDTVPRGANGVVMASYDLTASCDDSVTIQNMTILHEGFGASSDIDGVYATVDGARVTRRRTVDSQNQTSDIRFVKPLVIDACKTKTIDVVADFDSTAQVAAEHNLSIELPTDLLSNAKKVQGNFPLRGNTFKVGAVTSGQVTVSYRTVSPSTVSVGDTKVVLGRFEVDANSVEDQTVYSVTLEQNGSSKDGDVTNLMIRRSDGTVVTNTVAATVGNYATFVFDPPLTVLEGDKLTLEVVGDVVGGSANTVQFQFEENSDLFAVGSLYGYGVNGQLYGSQVSIASGTATAVTIKAGEFTVEIDGPTQQSFTKSQNSANIANITMTTAGDAIDLRHMYVAIQGQTSTGAGLAANGTTDDNINDIISNVQLRNAKSGQSISGVRLTTSGTDFATGSNSNSTYQIYRFDDFTVTGSDTWNLLVNFSDNGTGNHPLDGDQFRASVCTQPTSSTTGCDFGGLMTSTTNYNMEVKGLTTGDDVTDVRPGGTVTGNFQLIATPSLTVAVQSIGTSDTAVKNSKNVTLLRFQAQAGKAEDILFTQAIFRSQSGSLLNGQNYALWVDTDGDGVVDTILQKGVAAQSSQVAFNDLAGGGYVIPAQSTVYFEVHSDIAASLTNNDLLLAFDTGSSVSYISAEEVRNGSSLSGLKTIAPNGTSTCSTTTNCEIVTTVAWSKDWNLVSEGDLFVTKDTQPRSRQLLGGAVGDEVLRLQFRAQNEDIDVTNLQLNSSGSTATSVDALLLYKLGETSPFATATAGGCGSDDVLATNNSGSTHTSTAFCASMNNQQLVVKDGQDQVISVVPRMKSDEQGATSNETVQLWITKQAVVNNQTGSGAVRARGLQSSNILTANNGDSSNDGEIFIGTDSPAVNANIVGPVNKTVLSKITSITNANPDPDNTNVPTGVSPFAQFTFTAATNTNTLNGLNKATLSGVLFTVNATNVNIDATTFKFYNKNDSSTKATCSTYTTAGAAITGTASGSFLVDCRHLKATSVDTRIPSGASETFVLEGNITNSKTGSSNSGLQASLQNFSTLSNTTYGPSASHIDWVDEDTTATDFLWIEYGDTSVKSTSYKS